jgi:hypothetical protein
MGTNPRLFNDDDPFDDPLWRRATDMAGALPRPGEDYITCPLSWFAQVLPVLRASDRLAVALLLYRQCLMRRSRTVDLPNGELAKLGIGRRPSTGLCSSWRRPERSQSRPATAVQFG